MEAFNCNKNCVNCYAQHNCKNNPNPQPFYKTHHNQEEDVITVTRERMHEIEENAYQVGVTLGKSLGRKEMARELLCKLWHEKIEADVTILKYCSKEDVENIAKSIITSIRTTIKELAKQYNVGIE